MNGREINRLQQYPACHIDGYKYWTYDLHNICQRRGLNISQFTIFDCREYDDYTSARSALVEMINLKLYESAPPPETFTFINEKTGETKTGDIDELSKSFKYRSRTAVSAIIKGAKMKQGKAAHWRLLQ